MARSLHRCSLEASPSECSQRNVDASVELGRRPCVRQVDDLARSRCPEGTAIRLRQLLMAGTWSASSAQHLPSKGRRGWPLRKWFEKSSQVRHVLIVAAVPNCQGPGGTRCGARYLQRRCPSDASECCEVAPSLPLCLPSGPHPWHSNLSKCVGCANVFWIYRHIEDVVACLQGEGA